MRLTRDRIRHNYQRAKVLGRQAWSTAGRVLSVADRAAMLGAKGLLALGDQLDPEVRQTAGQALLHYTKIRQHMETCNQTCSEWATLFREAGFEI